MPSEHPNPILQHWNTLDASAAAQAILPCNGSQAWAASMASLAPFTGVDELLAAADAVWQRLPAKDRQQAFDSHPRIGERQPLAATAQSLAWSAAEQRAATADLSATDRLAAANRAYEAKFGRVFLICAAGRSAEDILAAMELRLGRDPATELREAAEQQRQITHLRLRRWLGLPQAS